jgi:hypothetical protein
MSLRSSLTALKRLFPDISTADIAYEADSCDSTSAERGKETSMIEVLPDMPAGVIGIRVSGRLRGDDLRDFRPAMENLLKTGEIRIVEVIASDYGGLSPGGLVEDLKLGFGALFQHHSAFKRIAVVSDKEWVTHTLHALAWMVPGELAMFGIDELEQAKEWAAG